MEITKPAAPLFVRDESGSVVADRDEVYPRYLSFMGFKVNEASQLSLELARRAFTEDLCKVVGRPLHLVLKNKGDPKKWALTKFPAAAGVDPAEVHKSVPSVNEDWANFYKKLPGTAAQRLGLV